MRLSTPAPCPGPSLSHGQSGAIFPLVLLPCSYSRTLPCGLWLETTAPRPQLKDVPFIEGHMPLPTPKALQEGCCSQKAWLDPSLKEQSPLKLSWEYTCPGEVQPHPTNPVITI